MLGVDDYGSDSDSERAERKGSPSPSPSVTLNSLVSPRPTPVPTPNTNARSSFKLPPPSNASRSTRSTPNGDGLSLPAPSTKKRGGPKKIMLELPKLSGGDTLEDEDKDERPLAKKPRTGVNIGEGGSRSSVLLSMLPAPKKTAVSIPAAAPRVLGGGRPGVVYSGSSSKLESSLSNEGEKEQNVEEEEKAELSTSLLPPSLAKSRVKNKIFVTAKPGASASVNPTVDFFSLGSSSTSETSTVPTEDVGGPSVASISISAAPKVEEFRPPSPTPNDAYPGYYMLPSGQWAMYDPAHYKTYYAKWQKDYEEQIRAYERGMDKGFEGAESEGTVEVKAEDQLDAARKEREEKMSLTSRAAREGEAKMPNMKINATKTNGLARTRHQLSTLLTDAYMNREQLEEQIAMAKRNRKEAGNKYGF